MNKLQQNWPPALLMGTTGLPLDLPGLSEVDERPSAFVAPDHIGYRALLGAAMRAGPDCRDLGWGETGGALRLLHREGLKQMPLRLARGADPRAGWGLVDAITPLALDVLTVLIDRLQARNVEAVLIGASEILSAKRRHYCGGELLAVQAQVGREILALGQLELGDSGPPALRVTELPGSERFVVALDPDLRAAWREAASHRIDGRILAFDNRANRGADLLAKKIGLYFSAAGASVRPVRRPVRSILHAIGGDAQLKGRAGRLADRFEEALLRLSERRVFAIRRCGADAPPLEDRNKGWIKAWLKTEVVVAPLGPGGDGASVSNGAGQGLSRR
ncbi:hypothetical protein [Phenylobacterium sp.]|jgi:hypothetical protein|uniref:hypothetical protein n=1 Tax=Phenylobacterium sp. TaxID=1871053 RepID=UPI003784B5F9